MRYFFTHNILYVATYDVGFGDFLANTICLNFIDNVFEHRVLFHYYINERIYERCGWYLHSQLPCDKVFIHPYEKSDSFLEYKFNNFPKNYYDFVILAQISNDAILNHILEKIKCKKILDNQNLYKEKKIESVYDYFKFYNLPFYNNSYSINNQLKKLFDFIGNEDYLAVFPFSTRYLASVNVKGILKVIKFAEDKKLKVLLCGENVCPYYGVNTNLNQQIHNFVDNCDNENVINVMGMNLNKIIPILEKAKYVFYGPTGISMLGTMNLVKNPNSFLLNGGDTAIMEDILVGSEKFLNRTKLKRSNDLCEYYPCGNFPQNINIEKINNCRKHKEAKCLNEDLNIVI